MKVNFKPGTMLNPVPVVMVSCRDKKGEKNIITIAWTGIVNSEPPMTYISVRKNRYSHHMIEEMGDFVINLVPENLAFATDYCGVKSGKDVDKFKEQNLTPFPSEKVKSPGISESPIQLECQVKEQISLPSHDMFLAEIVNVAVEEDWIDEKGRFRLDQGKLVAYNHGEYFTLSEEPLGKFGYSVMKARTKKRIAKEKRKEKLRKKQSR